MRESVHVVGSLLATRQLSMAVRESVHVVGGLLATRQLSMECQAAGAGAVAVLALPLQDDYVDDVSVPPRSAALFARAPKAAQALEESCLRHASGGSVRRESR